MMNQSKFLAITCPLLKALEKSCLQGPLSFGFALQWLKKNWHDLFSPFPKHSNLNPIIILLAVT